MTAGSARNYFDLFGIPVSFHVDMDNLVTRYRELQRANHPDRFANAGDRERLLAVQQAALINEAYHALKSPMQRGRYLLTLNGVEFNDEKQTTVDPEFLMEQMEWRETLAELRNNVDPLAVIQQLLREIQQRHSDLEHQLADKLEQSDWSEAKSLVHKLQFLEKLQSEAEILETELLDSI